MTLMLLVVLAVLLLLLLRLMVVHQHMASRKVSRGPQHVLLLRAAWARMACQQLVLSVTHQQACREAACSSKTMLLSLPRGLLHLGC